MDRRRRRGPNRLVIVIAPETRQETKSCHGGVIIINVTNGLDYRRVGASVSAREDLNTGIGISAAAQKSARGAICNICHEEFSTLSLLGTQNHHNLCTWEHHEQRSKALHIRC